MPSLCPKWARCEQLAIIYCHRTSLEAGITTAEAEARTKQFGPNALPELKESAWRKFFGYMWNPLSWVMELAAVMAIALSNGQGIPPNWQDFVGIVVLLFLNASLSYYEESQAGDAVAALKHQLASNVGMPCIFCSPDVVVLCPLQSGHVDTCTHCFSRFVPRHSLSLLSLQLSVSTSFKSHVRQELSH